MHPTSLSTKQPPHSRRDKHLCQKAKHPSTPSCAHLRPIPSRSTRQHSARQHALAGANSRTWAQGQILPSVTPPFKRIVLSRANLRQGNPGHHNRHQVVQPALNFNPQDPSLPEPGQQKTKPLPSSPIAQLGFFKCRAKQSTLSSHSLLDATEKLLR